MHLRHHILKNVQESVVHNSHVTLKSNLESSSAPSDNCLVFELYRGSSLNEYLACIYTYMVPYNVTLQQRHKCIYVCGIGGVN